MFQISIQLNTQLHARSVNVVCILIFPDECYHEHDTALTRFQYEILNIINIASL